MSSSAYKLFLFSIYLTNSIFAKPIFVTAEQFERPYLESTSSIELITREEIEESGNNSLIELLKSRVGLSIPTNGPFGKASSIQIRGADGRHTLVLIDGVRATDVTSISGGARLEFMGLDQIESIEILRGSQSVLYGSEAIGGVLKITTIKAESKKAKLKLAYGSYNNRIGSASIQGGKKLEDFSFNYSLGAGIQRVDGISAFNAKKTVGADEDGLNQTNFTGKFFLKKKEHSVLVGFQLTNSLYEYDDALADNPTSTGEYEDTQLFSVYSYEKSDLVNFNLSYTQKDVNRDLSGENSFGNFNYLYKGNFKRLELKNRMKFIEGGESIVGLELERESVDALDVKLSKTQTRDRIAGYINHYQKIESLIFEAGLRTERFQGFEEELVYKTSLGYRLGEFTIKGSFATGFKAPSLYQTFNTFAPSNKISHEESQSGEVGVLYVTPETIFELTLFEINYDNYIDYDLTLNRYVNRGDFLQRGMEINLEHDFKYWGFKSSYTYLRSKNILTGESLIRRPKNKISFSADGSLSQSIKLASQFDYIGKRDEVNNQLLPSYWTVGLVLSKDIANFKVKMALNNILDREYEEVLNFPAMGRNYLLSFSGQW